MTIMLVAQAVVHHHGFVTGQVAPEPVSSAVPGGHWYARPGQVSWTIHLRGTATSRHQLCAAQADPEV